MFKRYKMKKLISILLLSATILSLGACGFPGFAKDPQKIDMLASEQLAAAIPSITEDTARESGVYLEERRVSFAATGDNIIYTSTWTDARNHAAAGGYKAEYDFKPIYKNVLDMISKPDIAFLTQETLMTGGANSAYPRFNSPRELGHDLVGVGFDVINIANNHMLDKGAAGLSATIDFYDTLSATMIGGYKNEADFNRVRIVEKNGIKIAFLAFTEHTNYIKLDAGSELYIPYTNDEAIKRQTKAAREAADIVIVAMHWGDEYVQKQNANQERLAKLLAECEVDVILGSHSHSIQPIVELDRPSGKKTLCIYSLGNFLNAMDQPVNMVGGFLNFDIVKPEVGDTRIENVVFNPVVCHFGPSRFNSALYPLDSYTDELAAIHYVDITVAKLKSFVTGTIDAKYLPDYLK